jgi:hypothetical protein
MIKFCALFAIAFLLTNHSFAMTTKQCVDHTLELIERNTQDRRRCLDLQIVDLASMKEFPKCFIRATMVVAENACFPSMRATARIQNFLWQQEILNVENFERKLISFEQLMEQSRKTITLVREEEEAGSRAGLAELKRIDKAEAQRRESDRIDNAIRLLGGAVRQFNPERNSRTYILNNRVINCFDHGSVTTCN